MTAFVVAYDAELAGECLAAARVPVALHEREGVPATWFVVGQLLKCEGEWRSLHTIRTRALIPLLTWAPGARVEGSRRLERKADAAVLRQLAATIAPPERQPLYAALQETIMLYGTLRGPVFSRYDIQTDLRAEETPRHAIARHWTPSPAAE